MEGKILLAYSTPQFKCYQVSKLLVAWVHIEGQILFGNAVPADSSGLADLRTSGLLRKEYVEHLRKLCKNQSLKLAFE